ncbi:MAG: hypothetical protein NTX82_04925 [Candidatus Parcubacteria bacterium]|nr:hypothetical protein [Candidatus Parcubacteria bacterium]
MLYYLFTIAYILDAFLLALLIVFIVLIIKLLKTLGQNFTLREKMRLIPIFLTKHSHYAFLHHAKKNDQGTYQAPFHKYTKLNITLKHLMHGALGFLMLKIIITGLIFWYIPKPTEAQPTRLTYNDKGFTSFSAGSYKLTQFENDAIFIAPGSYSGNYISQSIGDGKAEYNWQSLSWEADRVYNKRPDYPTGKIAVWSLDSLEYCSDSLSRTYNCKIKNIALTNGLYQTKAYYFDGENSKAKIEANLSFKDSFTIGTWVKFDEDILVGSAEQNYIFLGKGYGDYYIKKNPYQLKYNYYFGILDGALTFKYWSDDNPLHWGLVKDTNNNFTANRWYHLAVSFDSKTKSFKVFIDGIDHTEVVTDYDEGALNHFPNTGVNLPTWIGGIGYLWMDNEEKMVNVMKGTLDELFITNTAMNVLDLRKIINQSGEIYFQIRTSNTLPLVGNFWGPGGRLDTYFTQNQTDNLKFAPASKYLQYIAFFSRPITNFNPKLYSVTVEYSDGKIEQEQDLKISLSTIQTNASSSRNITLEKEALGFYISIFKSLPQSDQDWQFINLFAYNKNYQRDLSQEQKAITAFNKFYKKLPQSSLDWSIIRVLSYSVKGQTLMANWLKIK